MDELKAENAQVTKAEVFLLKRDLDQFNRSNFKRCLEGMQPLAQSAGYQNHIALAHGSFR